MYALRWYQSEAVSAAWGFLCKEAGNPCVVLPTGAGKSVVIAELVRRSVEIGKRVICLAHRKELLEQNADKITTLLPDCDIGIYSAGLRSRDTDHQVVMAGIQSVHKRALELGERHLVIVDESHLVPSDGEGMYRTFFDDLRTANPNLRTIGLTATPFRTGEGKLCGANRLFQKVCYDAPIQRLIADGFLSPVVNRSGDSSCDTSELHIRGGEFVQHELEALFSRQSVPACREVVLKSQARKSILVFCSGVEHAETVAEEIKRLTGESVGVIHGGTMPLLRATTLEMFRQRRLRWLVNVDVLTTGFDAPSIDCIAILRATMSPGLFAQIVGRGFRTCEGKADFLVLDFGENIQRHGPVDAIDYGKESASKGNGDAPVKSCPNCEEESLIAARECEDCGFRFPEPEARHGDAADEQSQILASPKQWRVEEIKYSRHRKRKATEDSIDTLRVDYTCQPIDDAGDLTEQVISEWVCIEHEGWSRRKAAKWWTQRSIAVAPSTIDEAIDLWLRGAVAGVQQITTIKDGRWDRVTDYVFDEIPQEWSDEAIEMEMEDAF